MTASPRGRICFGVWRVFALQLQNLSAKGSEPRRVFAVFLLPHQNNVSVPPNSHEYMLRVQQYAPPTQEETLVCGKHSCRKERAVETGPEHSKFICIVNLSQDSRDSLATSNQV